MGIELGLQNHTWIKKELRRLFGDTQRILDGLQPLLRSLVEPAMREQERWLREMRPCVNEQLATLAAMQQRDYEENWRQRIQLIEPVVPDRECEPESDTAPPIGFHTVYPDLFP
jgi:hypothetical protein